MPKSTIELDPSKSFRASTQVGESVAVELRGGGGTGFAWEPTEPLPSGVEIVKEHAVPNARHGIGAMGREILKFSFSKPGTYDLDLGFVSPSGSEVVEKKKLKFDVE